MSKFKAQRTLDIKIKCVAIAKSEHSTSRLGPLGRTVHHRKGDSGPTLMA